MRGVTGSGDKTAGTRRFQLTRLMRGVTSSGSPQMPSDTFQLTRLMRGVTALRQERIQLDYNFNSHASCEA